ncbi:MAG: pyruvate dehydrogenase (acetyl-transferring), homodimeric type [Candidatus Marinimicrobia bacterium]|nr:pyruvate dehydrogenase (acetyl-transferring), homodimeric type [Candidatus Neomarinimicrobiota bacterium]MBT4713313.1 pyruvate dehydrogenase (acetyl-transferring), homodimeric type [Candidatus Neomarinimicrobiota bacterium]MBT4944834.1 pyruvate dehydrogenase (acetyl-transferring), homodimeric type [Candidatus Neomarinimicrobiota bacterium]MBT5271670.1 pyruvate dehydrogenase (acetyl-transferring), homodimeric type [Candidatus Neomarinimicrobiota bacterium]MBT6010044.1 pyruvate dehydrogenase (
MHKDTDPQETSEWLDSLAAVFEEEGVNRAHFLVNELIDYASRHGVRLPYSANTSYLNTIPVSQQPQFPGDRAMERRIKSIVRWNAMAMVVRANKVSDGIGGHISTYASSATLLEIGFNHFFRSATDEFGGDLVYFQGHGSPGIYARAFLEGRLSEQDLVNFRRELADGGGLSSYPHPWLMPNFWQFPTVSMGLGPLQAIYQARFMRYMENRELIPRSDRKVWAFLGDGEMDEPESLGAITLASREKLDNLIFVVNCNMQRLDGPVRGNGKVVQELEGAFRGAGWNVIKVIWGSEWDELLAKDKNGILAKRMEEVVDGDILKYIVEGGAYIREHFFGAYPELLEMVNHLSDEDLEKLKRGGHDPAKVYAAFSEALAHADQPTVILTSTVKGYGMGEAGEGKNITHGQKKLNENELKAFRSRFGIPISDDEVTKAPFYRPDENSEEVKYLKARREVLGGHFPARRSSAEPTKTPELSAFKAALEGTGDRAQSTTMAFVRILSMLTKDKTMGKRVVPIVPDEARTFGMEALFRSLGIYSSVGQLYDPVDSDQYLYYREDIKGQILEEGITEAGSSSSWVSAATSYSTHGVNMMPFYIYYSMFGFQRVGDMFWLAGDIRARGFLLGATAGRTTLNGEGLQHQDGHSLLAAATIPNCRAYDPAYSYEIAVIIQHGMKRMMQDQIDEFYYITLENEPYVHPAMPKNTEEGIIKGMYQLSSTGKAKADMHVQLMGSGAILGEVQAAADILKKEWKVTSDIWSVTSYSELRLDAQDAQRWNRLHPTKERRKAYACQLMENKVGPVIATSDYIKLVAEQISIFIDKPFIALGTDGFGRSESREELRKFFEVDRYSIVVSALFQLQKLDVIKGDVVAKAIKKYDIPTESDNPVKR